VVVPSVPPPSSSSFPVLHAEEARGGQQIARRRGCFVAVA